VKRRWLVAPVAALILLFSAGAAVAPQCHVVSTSQTPNKSALLHSHSGVLHDHSPQSDGSLISNSQETSASAGSAFNKEICFIVGFIVLLLLRFSHLLRSIFSVRRIPRPRLVRPLFLSKNLGYLNLTHLKLGIIRI
jgi:hypothetical protein